MYNRSNTSHVAQVKEKDRIYVRELKKSDLERFRDCYTDLRQTTHGILDLLNELVSLKVCAETAQDLIFDSIRLPFDVYPTALPAKGVLEGLG
jgi:hypothetical protein